MASNDDREGGACGVVHSEYITGIDHIEVGCIKEKKKNVRGEKYRTVELVSDVHDSTFVERFLFIRDMNIAGTSVWTRTW
jgi:hypothetical protein